MLPDGFSGKDWREWRRLWALQWKERGWSRRDIAEALGVAEDTVGRWIARARVGGREALLARPGPGRSPRLTPRQRRLIPELLWHGPEAYGFRGEVWTCARIAKVIEQEFGVSYHKGHVARLLQGLRWTPQVSIRRAIRRDEAAIESWRSEVWPELLKRSRRERRVLVFVDESGFYLLPGVVKTDAPFGAHAGTAGEIDTRPSLGHGRHDAGGQDRHPGPAGAAQRAAHGGVPSPPGSSGR